ncbi:MAG: hypothetical protein L0332_32925 [Chloroflexi bacterium]|nr:hypothetical protein [Chloroflexota bacterium]MCI0580782.1 hypothetical protein [Chloroflexota bacterium]MCI0648695.1 hypothetical protein [Chloroflexota bacterium]MCI0731508.1 hypothetical protein [Chloroflexota bacterium]
MKFMTEDAKVVCKHENGVVGIKGTQNLVTINQRQVLVETDPEGRPISGCPNVGATIKPCTATLKVEVGYSDLIRIAGRRVCLDTVTGLTDGTPPGTVKYVVRDPGQTLVAEAA